jgi:hypothetical protein
MTFYILIQIPRTPPIPQGIPGARPQTGLLGRRWSLEWSFLRGITAKILTPATTPSLPPRAWCGGEGNCLGSVCDRYHAVHYSGCRRQQSSDGKRFSHSRSRNLSPLASTVRSPVFRHRSAQVSDLAASIDRQVSCIPLYQTPPLTFRFFSTRLSFSISRVTYQPESTTGSTMDISAIITGGSSG